MASCSFSSKNNSISPILFISSTFLLFFLLSAPLLPRSEAISPYREKSICGPAECVRGKKFHYKEGNVYVYQYNINGTTAIARGPTEQSGLHLSAQVALKFITPCEAVIFIRAVELWQSKATAATGNEHQFNRRESEEELFKSALEEYPLRLSYGDGLIEEVCPDSRETPWVLNIKRGLVSAFQNTMRRLDLEHKGDEEDIHGHCKVEYKLGSATSSSLTIDKIKDLSSCGDKFGIFSSVQGTPYNFGSKYQSMPAVASTCECHQIVDRNLIAKTQCSESHRLKTLARGVAGVVTSIQQTLELITIYDPNYVPEEGIVVGREGSRPADHIENDDNETESEDDQDGNSNMANRKEIDGEQEEGTETNLPSISSTLPPLFSELLMNYEAENVIKRESLHFKHDFNNMPTAAAPFPSPAVFPNDLASAKMALEEFCNSVKGEVKSGSGEYFDTLIHILRAFNLETMRKLSREAATICHGDRTHFDNALEAVGTSASVGVIKEKILKREVSPSTIHSWISSLTFIQKPDLELMEYAVEMLKERDSYPQILLTFSSLAHSFCQSNPECGTTRPITVLTKLYEKTFNYTGCVATRPVDMEQLVTYLKGIGNFGTFSNGINQALLTCIFKQNKEELKVAALEAYRRMSCNSDQSVLKSVFEDELEDSEVRIAAFIGLMRCPTYSTIRSIKETLEREQVNQVGSFVWTYLKNLQKTALPSKAELQGLVADENLSERFASDVRKFSRNFEISTFHDDLNFGIGAESNLIFSPKSYLPRSVMLNMTVDLFGESINVFEAGLRVENFEYYIESMFGPKGRFANRDLHSIISSLRTQPSQQEQQQQQKKQTRPKRAVPSKRKLRTLSLESEAYKRYHSDPIASFSLKTFGNEIFYERSSGADETDFIGSLNPFQLIKQLGNKDINWQKSKLLLESSYIIPTGVGIPLNLSASASSILRLNTMSLMDVENLRAGSELKLHGKFEPSALLSVKGSMAFGSGVFQTGVQVRASLHTSTMFEGSFHVKGTKLLKIDVGLPKTKQQLLEYKSEILFMHGNSLQPIGRLPPRNPICTNGFLDKTLGIKLCKSSYFSLSPGSEKDNHVSPYFPLNGPAQFALTIEKTNPALLKTRLNYEWDEDEKGTKVMAMYEVEGSETTKLLGFTYNLNKLNQDFSFGANIPGNALEANGFTKNNLSGGLNITATSTNSNMKTFHALATYVKKPTKGGTTTTTATNDKMNTDVDLLVTVRDSKILDAKVKVIPTELGTGDVSFAGDGRLYLTSFNNVNLQLKGQLNETRLEFILDSSYVPRTSSTLETLKWKGMLSRTSSHAETSKQIDTSLNLESSEFPDYNLDASWNYKADAEGVESHTDFRIGRGPTWSDRDVLRIKHGLVSHSTYEGTRRESYLWVIQPSNQIDCGFQTNTRRIGGNLDTIIKLKLTPEKIFETSLSLKRAPGVLTFFQIGWNTTISNQHPLQISFYLQETSNRVYQGKFQTDWFGSNNINIGLNFMDRTKRQQFNKELKLSIETSSSSSDSSSSSSQSPILLSALVHHDVDKESKLLFSYEYQARALVWELSRKTLSKGGTNNKQTLLASYKNGPKVYLIQTDMDTSNKGLNLKFKTDLQSKFPDVVLELRVQQGTAEQGNNGMHSLALLYKWNAARDESQKLALDFFIDSTLELLRRVELKLNYPGQSLVFIGQHERANHDKNQRLTGELNWNEDLQLHLNASYEKCFDSVESQLSVLCQGDNMKDAVLSLKLSCDNQMDCQVSGETTWDENEHLNLNLESALRSLASESDGGENEDDDEDEKDYESSKVGRSKDYDIDNDDDDDDDDDYDKNNDDNDGGEEKNSKTLENKGKKSSSAAKPFFASFRPFSFSLKGNMTSSMDDWNGVQISMLHNHQSPLHLKTDIEIQLPNGNDINIASHWFIPINYKQLWSTRAELHVKTPFETLQNFHLQAVIGHQEDSDTLATAGIYMDSLQYSMTITGTPRFGEDGSLRIEISTSNPAYDKIFSSLSYAIGDSSRLAYQLGWPNVVIGLEMGLEWDGSWEEFQIFCTFTSPWKPLKNINALAKIDTAQVEVKLELNDDIIGIKADWVIESFAVFDIRLECVTPFPDLTKAGFLLKNSFEDDVPSHSQVSLYCNEKQIGYKLEGGRSEVEEGAIVAVLINSQIEIDTYVYPTIRSTFNFAQRETKFNIGLSLLLREGPINVSVELHLLDLYCFNEKITATTPYPGLFELEINLSPAVFPERSVYNFGSHLRWRSRSEWQEAGFTLRYGDQSIYRDILQQFAEHEEEDDDDDYDSEDYDDEPGEQSPPKVTVKSTKKKPKEIITVESSQLLHFFGPISWARILKIEFEKLKTGEGGGAAANAEGDNEADDDDGGDDDDDDSGDKNGNQEGNNGDEAKNIKRIVFPIRTFSFIHKSDASQLTADLQNEPTLKQFNTQFEIQEIGQPCSYKLEAIYDSAHHEKKFNINAVSYLPQLDQITISSSWQTAGPTKSANIELRTPFEHWEVQSVNAMYAQNVVEKVYTHDWEIKSDTFGKMGTNLVYGPLHFMLTLNTPLENYKEMELHGVSRLLKAKTPKKFNTIVTFKIIEKEILSLDVDSIIENGMPTQMSGAITSTLRGYRDGNLTASVQKNPNRMNANGLIDWRDEKLKVTVEIKMPKSKFEELDLRVETPFDNYANWKLFVQREQTDSDEDDENETDTDDDGDDDDDYEDTSESKNSKADSFSFVFKADTPIPNFSTVTGRGSFPMVSSFHAVKKLTLSGNAPNGSIDIMTSWITSDWNSFDIHCDSKYSHSIQHSFLPSALRSLPSHNFLKFKLRNVIPSLESISLVDSVFYYEIEQPAFRLGTTALVEIKTGQTLSTKLSLKLPHNTHSLDIKSVHDSSLRRLNADLAYTHGVPSTKWTTNIQFTRDEKSLQGKAEIDLGKSNPFQSNFNYTLNRPVSQFYAELFPKNDPNIPIATVDGTFDLSSANCKTRFYALDRDYPTQPILADLNVDYKNLFNFDTKLNGTTPYYELPVFGLLGSAKTKGRNNYEGRFGFHLAENITFFKYNLAFDNFFDMTKFNGSVAVDLPFEEFQSGSIGGSFNNKITSLESTLRAELNSIVYMDSLYTSESSSRAGIEKEWRKVEVDNPFWPIGISKYYQYQYSGGYNGLNLPTTTLRLVEVYDLVQRDLHKLGGELKIQTNFNGREITLSGIHPSRRVKFTTNYEFLDHQFKHNANLSYSSDSWIGYELDIKNKTTVSKGEHSFDLRINYPVRVISLNAICLSQKQSFTFTTNANMNASQSDRKLTSIFYWEVTDENTRKMSIILKHPSLTQDIRAASKLTWTEEQVLLGDVRLDYAGELPRSVLLESFTTLPFRQLALDNYYYWNLTSHVKVLHSATNMELKAFSSTSHSPHELSIITLIDFKNREKLVKKSKISFELFKELKQVHIMLNNPEEYLNFRGELIAAASGQQYSPLHYVNVETNITGSHPHMKGQMTVDSSKPYFTLYAVHNEGRTDGIFSEGGIIDSRNVKFHIYESYDNFKYYDVNFFLRMNHSRLVTSRLKWRPELFQELQTAYRNEVEKLQRIWKQQSEKLVRTVSTDVSRVITQIWDDAEPTIGPFLEEMSEDFDFGKDMRALRKFFQEARENNDFYSQDIGGIAQVFADEVSVRYANVYIKIRQYRQEILGDTTTSEMFENALLWILEKMKDSYRKISKSWNEIQIDTSWAQVDSSSYISKTKEKLAAIFHQILEKSLDASINIYHGIGNALSDFGGSIKSYGYYLFEKHKQSIFGVVHRVEIVLYNILVEISDYLYETQNELFKSTIYQKLTSLGRDIDQLYYDLSRYSTKTNIRKYTTLFKNFMRRKYGDVDEIQKQLGEMGSKISNLWNRFLATPPIQAVKNSLSIFNEQILWTVHYFKLDQLAQEVVISLYHRGHDLLYQTVIEANARYQQFKTRFIFDADKGNIEWEQKLPMPWNAFNETPVFTELPEHKNIVKLRNFFQSSSGSFWDSYFKTEMTKYNSEGWLPPFDGNAMMVGPDKFFTFDGKFYTFSGPCAYLLTTDLIDGNFSIAVQYKNLKDGSFGHETIVTAGHNTLIFDFEENGLRDPKKNLTTLSLPVQMQYLQGYQDKSNLVVQHTSKAFTFNCNMKYQICQLKVSGWYSRKLGGLFGTMDDEPTTDFVKPNGEKAIPKEMAMAWDISDENVEPCVERVMKVDGAGLNKVNPEVTSVCTKFFADRFSSLEPCFNVVNPSLYLDVCSKESPDSFDVMCTSAMAYVHSCQVQGINVQLPSRCIRCEVNGEQMIDRDVKVVDTSSFNSLSSADIVLIVEAKDCNRHVQRKKRMSNLISSLETELIRQGFRNNRYSVVAFGGAGVYSQPHSITHNNQIFITANQVEKLFVNLPPSAGIGEADMFEAINYGLSLNFRPGVSKTFVLMPCSSCQQNKMDFPTIRHAMLEQDATLHILMNSDFPLDNKKLAKKFFGIDNDAVYTKFDGKNNVLKGNTAMRKQFKLYKPNFGYCSPLSLETNGTIFNARKLLNKRENVAKWFSNVFTQRVSQTAKSSSCQACICSADENGLGKLDCYLCDDPRFKYISENEIENDSTEKFSIKDLETSTTDNTDPDDYVDNKNDDEEDEEEY